MFGYIAAAQGQFNGCPHSFNTVNYKRIIVVVENEWFFIVWNAGNNSFSRVPISFFFFFYCKKLNFEKDRKDRRKNGVGERKLF